MGALLSRQDCPALETRPVAWTESHGRQELPVYGSSFSRLPSGEQDTNAADRLHVLDEAHGRLYVSRRFDDGVSIVDLTRGTETSHLLTNPEPTAVTAGRPFLYDVLSDSAAARRVVSRDRGR
jgi:hypothetical protein